MVTFHLFFCASLLEAATIFCTSEAVSVGRLAMAPPCDRSPESYNGGSAPRPAMVRSARDASARSRRRADAHAPIRGPPRAGLPPVLRLQPAGDDGRQHRARDQLLGH